MLKYIGDHFFAERQGVIFSLSLIGYVICGLAVMSYYGNSAMSFADPGAEQAIAFWMVIIAIIGFVQLSLGLVALYVQVKAREPVIVFSLINALFGLFFFGYCVLTPIAMAINS